MKRAASKTDVRIFESRPDPLFCQSPPRCEFYDEDGCARREFNNLSRTEKEKVMKDIYGIEEAVEETPEIIREGLEQMNNILLECANKKESLKVARDRYPSFFEDEVFRLQFLRVDAFNAKQASNRLIRHLEKKMKLFGPNLLGQKIKLEHLSDDDMEFMRSGGLQVIPAKDRGGRHLMLSSHRKWNYKDVKNVSRCMWYLLMVLVEESGSNICDTVEISYNLGQFSAGAFDRSALKSVFDLFKATPTRLVGYHYCFDDVRFRMVYGVITVFLGKKARMRARDHEGSHVECRYGLMSYGIPVDELCVMSDGIQYNSKFDEWLEERAIKEKQVQDDE